MDARRRGKFTPPHFYVAGIVLVIWWGVTPHWRCKSCSHRWYVKEPEELDEEEGDSVDEDEVADGDAPRERRG